MKPRTGAAARVVWAAALYRGDARAGMYDDRAVREPERLHGIYADALRGLTVAWELLEDLEEAEHALGKAERASFA